MRLTYIIYLFCILLLKKVWTKFANLFHIWILRKEITMLLLYIPIIFYMTKSGHIDRYNPLKSER